MGREIKFRAWDNKWKVMVEYFHFINKQDEYKSKLAFVTYPSYREDIPYSNPNIDGDYILMQYTGLKDKNSKEIYSHDIVKINNKIGYVWFCEFCGRWEFQIPTKGFPLSGSPWVSLDKALLNVEEDIEGNSYEVIGNLYENKELLEGK